MRKLYITAGHRGKGTGSVGLIDEGEEVISFRNSLSKKLAEKGLIVFNDRDADSLSQVINKINTEFGSNDIAIDLHFNAFNGTARGTEVFHRNNPSTLEIELSEQITYLIASTLDTKNRGVKREGTSQYNTLAQLSQVKANSILIEICFCDNEQDVVSYKLNKNKLIDKLTDLLYKYAKS